MRLRFKLWNLAVVFGLGLISLQQSVSGDDWPTFRGPNRTSVVNDSNLLKKWPEGGPKLLWEGTGAGLGYSSLAIVGNKIFTLGDGLSTQNDKDEYLTCFDRTNGKQLWATKTGEPWKDRQADWQSSRSTPTVDGNMVYVVTPYGKLFSCQVSDGKIVWQKDLKADFGGKKDDSWGYSESVLIDGNRLLCTPGGSQATVVALEKETGKTIWTCTQKENRGAGHSSIVISKVGGKKVYVQSTGSGLIGISDTGSLLWEYPIDKTTAVIPTPIVRDDLVFFPVGYKRGGALVKQVPEADFIKVKEIYPLNTKLANKHGGVVLVGNNVFGDSDDAGAPYCADLMTGEIKWQAPKGEGKGSTVVIGAGNHVYFRYANGVVAMVEADPSGFKLVSSFKIPDAGPRPGWSHPVVLDGKLFIREQDRILCYDIRG